MRRGRFLGRILAAGALVGLSHPARAADASRTVRASARDAAYLEAAFRHDLCTRDDRELRKLSRALAKPAAGGGH